MSVPQKFYRGDDAPPSPRAICRRALSPASLPISDTERQEERRQEFTVRQDRIEVLRRQVAAGKQLDFARASRQLAGLEPWDEVSPESLALRSPSPTPWVPVGERICWCRQRDGLSRKALAQQAGIAEVTVSRAEKGCRVALRVLEAIGGVLGCSTHWLLTGEEEPCRKAA